MEDSLAKPIEEIFENSASSFKLLNSSDSLISDERSKFDSSQTDAKIDEFVDSVEVANWTKLDTEEGDQKDLEIQFDFANVILRTEENSIFAIVDDVTTLLVKETR